MLTIYHLAVTYNLPTKLPTQVPHQLSYQLPLSYLVCYLLSGVIVRLNKHCYESTLCFTHLPIPGLF